MLNENLKAIRKSKGLSQQELAIRLNVVRQTISKWEQGLSVPDSDMLLTLSEALETPVSVLLGETIEPPKAGDFGKAGTHKSAARAAEECETENASLAVSLTVRDHSNGICGFGSIEQLLPGLGL